MVLITIMSFIIIVFGFYSYSLFLLPFFPRFKDINTYKYIDDALLITSIIFIIMTYFYYMYSDLFLNNLSSIGMGLLLSLLVIIIVEVIHLLFYANSQFFFYIF